MNCLEKVLTIHNPAAQDDHMVYEVWNDGEVTLTKGAELYGQRGLHCIEPGSETSWDAKLFPLVSANGFGRIQVLTRDDADYAREIIINNGPRTNWTDENVDLDNDPMGRFHGRNV
jgi:hypothetical protein